MCKTLTFKEGNGILYGQDFKYRWGIPSGTEFEVDKIERESCWLKASGYGGKPYGDGRLWVPYRVKGKWNAGKRGNNALS